MCWIAISESQDTLEQLRKYILRKFESHQGVTLPRKMAGSMQPVFMRQGVFILRGSWEGCSGYDLGYWLKHDNVESFVENVMFFEGCQEDIYIRLYSPADTADGKLGTRTIVGDCYSLVPEDDMLQSYEDVWPEICHWLARNRTKMWLDPKV